MAAQLATGAGPVTNLRRHVADPAHTTVLRVLRGSRTPLRTAAPAPPLRDEGAPGDGGGGDGGNGSGAPVPERRCRPRCVWGEAVCRALLGDKNGDNCEEEEEEAETPPELRREDGKPHPFVRAPPRVCA